MRLLKPRNTLQKDAETMYDAVQDQARRPYFYEIAGVPDTFEGRFDLLVLHASLLMRRLQHEDRESAAAESTPDEEGGQPTESMQSLFDVMFKDMEYAMRELGAGDLGVPKHIKRMMKAFKGRYTAYSDALESKNNELIKKEIFKNLFDQSDDVTPAQLEYMTRYMTAQDDHLAGQSLAHIYKGQGLFIAPETLS